MANTFKFGGGNWAVKDGYALAYNDENNNFKPLPFDFTRASSATRVNRQGLIETVPSGKPRIDFTDNTSGHLLLEPSRTNLMPYSEDFSTGNWAALSGSSVQANVAISPDGTQNASRFNYDGTGNGRVEWGFISGLTSGVTYTFSVYLKSESGEVQNVQIGHSGWGLETVTVSSEWKRYTQTVTSNSTTAYPRVKLDTANSILVWGYQMEVGSYPTSYIKTEGSSVTRVVDDADNSLPSNDAFNSSGSVSILFNIQGRELTGSNSTGNNISFEFGSSNRVAYNHNATNYHRIEINTSGYARYLTLTELSTVNVKIGVTVTATTAVVYVNGTQTHSVTLAATHDFTSLDSIATAITEAIGNVKIKELRFYNTPLTNTELQNLTS